MGNGFSQKSQNEKEFNNFYEVIDFVASRYITTMNFKSLQKLSEKEYCDDLVIITSDLIQSQFNELDVEYLAQRVKSGIEVNEMKHERVTFLNKTHLENLDIKNDKNKNVHKKRMCIGIAKFYVKIAHLFAAIVTTINPTYTYTDETNSEKTVTLENKNTIPKNVPRKIQKLNICDNRLSSLKFDKVGDGGLAKIHPNVCEINKTNAGNMKSLADEPGIPELMTLYLDDKYDYSTGKFVGMSARTEMQFKRDLELMYTTFTGEKSMPSTIKTFKDIKLKDYEKNCSNNRLKTKITVETSDAHFKSYAKNIKQMMDRASNKQSELLSVINDLFTIEFEPYLQTKQIRVNAKLNEILLQKLVEKSRRIIVELYVNCENDYVDGIKLYEAIVEMKIADSMQNQILSLQAEVKQLENSEE